MATYPDAMVRSGIIFDIETHIELPSYQGLCLADLAGRFAVLHTMLTTQGRTWELVHWGSALSSTEIEKWMKGKEV